MATSVNTNSERDKNLSRKIKCSFCSEEQSPGEIGEHLLQCGNKTEQCPNCEKWIRRAIFAYHYENNCARDPDDIGDDPNPTIPKQSPEKSPPVEKFKSVTVIPVNMSQPSIVEPTVITKVPQERTIPITCECKYCHNKCDIKDNQLHEDKCLENPKNKKHDEMRTMQTSAARKPILNQPVNNETVECQICNKQIELRYFDAHENVCLAQETNAAELEGRLREIKYGETPRCRYCKIERDIKDLIFHENVCRKNKLYANDPVYQGSFRTPAPFDSDPKLFH